MKGRMAALIVGAGAMVAALTFVASDADARAGRGGSIGSRGTNTYSAPPATTTAPKTSPIDRSITQPGRQTAAPGVPNAGSATAAASRFGGMKGILLGGLFGFALASIIGPGVLASMLGGLLWFALIGGLVLLAVNFFRARAGGQPAMAHASAAPRAAPAQDPNMYRANSGGVGGPAALSIAQADYDAFERLLGEIQTAYGRSDVKALERMTTPEMLSYFAKELDENAKSGVRNELSNVKLLQGDLAEAWREPGGEYATVAMRYAITDAFVELKTGKVYSGSRTETEEVTEVWTFYRPAGADASAWELSAIQQA